MDKPPEIKLDVPTREILDKLISDSPPLGMKGAPALHVFHRDLYFDARDRTLERRAICCRLRTRSDDTRVLSLEIRAASSRQVHEQVVREVDPHDVLRGNSDPARRLRAIIDPDRLEPTIELETERHRRRFRSGLLPFPRFEFVYDVVTVRSENATHSFCELKIRRLRRGTPSLERVVQDLQSRFALRTTLPDKVERAKKYLARLESRTLSEEVLGTREIALIATHQGEIAMRRAGNELALPVE